MHGEVVPVRVTVVIPAHDEEEYIGRAIRSVLGQDTSGVEILVVDDHSTDRTASIARSFPGVRVVSNPGRGVVDALNHGLDTALGDIVVRLDADDVSLAGGVKNLAAALDLHPAASLAVGRAVFVDRAGNRIAEHGIVPDRASMRVVSMAINPIVHSAVAYRRAHVVALGGYRCDDTTEVAQDFDLWSRLLEAGDVVVVPVEVAEQWFWPTSTTSRRVAEQRRRAIEIRRRNVDRWSAERARLAEIGRAVRRDSPRSGWDTYAFALCRLVLDGLRWHRPQVVLQASIALVRLGPHLTVPGALRTWSGLRRRRRARGW